MKLRNPSPLRYPGGKTSLVGVLESLIYGNQLQGCTYVEPFAGGAGAGLKLLSDGHVDRVIINDADKAVYAFWKSIVTEPDNFIDRIMHAPLNVEEWERQREVYRRPGRRKRIDLGFAAFYLNRCNRSGIIMNGGPIGGYDQKGKWKIDARFNRTELSARITHLAGYGDRIAVFNMDAKQLLADLEVVAPNERCFVYADPPYYMKGQELYLNHFADEDHASFAEAILDLEDTAWAITYDAHPRIRSLYSSQRIQSFRLRYSAHHESTEGGELLITPRYLIVDPEVRVKLNKLSPTSA